MTAPGAAPRARCRSRPGIGGGGGGGGGGGEGVGGSRRNDSSSSRSRSREDQRQPSFLVYQPGLWEELLEAAQQTEDREEQLGYSREGPEKRQEKRQEGDQGGGKHTASTDLKGHLSRLSR